MANAVSLRHGWVTSAPYVNRMCPLILVKTLDSTEIAAVTTLCEPRFAWLSEYP